MKLGVRPAVARSWSPANGTLPSESFHGVMKNTAGSDEMPRIIVRPISEQMFSSVPVHHRSENPAGPGSRAPDTVRSLRMEAGPDSTLRERQADRRTCGDSGFRKEIAQLGGVVAVASAANVRLSRRAREAR
ncbi:MAG: hypothetical protein B7Z68_04845 [Acidobacteria bacterium 21-70-11]|nr:MAG: hypothetical protein B7Z68_04845 [Acidobacteria bacterium 21-70-11]OYW06976.1 MAG: hypothetical protein B7Z61_00470 [Acidobacteria bacterium 37-71-11]